MQLTRTRSVGIVLGKDPELYSLVPLKALDFLFYALFLYHEHLGGSQDWSLVCWRQNRTEPILSTHALAVFSFLPLLLLKSQLHL